MKQWVLQNRFLTLALVVSVLIHLVLLSIHFKLPELIKKPSISPAIAVTLVNAISKDKPTKADKLAQANLDGGGNTDAAKQLQSPLPVTAQTAEQMQLDAAATQVRNLEAQATAMMAELKRQRLALPTVQTGAAKDQQNELARKTIELQKLEAQIARELEAYQQRPKKKHIGARTEEYRFARYAEDWRLKIEKIGNEYYPQDKSGNKLFGSLILTVGIKADGTIESVEIDKGSGRRLLDTQALRIIKLATPFTPFPADLRRDTDILYITRTWTFTREEGMATLAQ
jgi:periplasmic protein TonB